MSTRSNPMQPQRFQLTQIEGPDGKPVIATIQREKKGCIVKFSHDEEHPVMNYVKNRKTGEEEHKQFSVFIPQNPTEVLRRLTNQKGKIVPHRKNPKQLFLIWEHVMVSTKFTLYGKLLEATFTTSVKKDEEGTYYQTIFRFYTEDGKLVKHTIKGKEKIFTLCFRTDCKEDVTDGANREWLLQEGQLVPHTKYEGSLFLRLGKAPVKTSFTFEVDGKDIPVYARTRVDEEKDENGNSLYTMKMSAYSNDRVITHYNSKGKRVPFVYSYMTNNPQHVTPEAIKQWYEDTSGNIVPHKKIEGKLFLLFKR